MGISLYGLTPATTYDALIKTGDNEPLTASLKVLSDGVGTNLPMEASTTGINFTGALQQSGVAVPTASQVAAKQDTLVSGTNIKTINGTSVLGSGNIAVVTSPSGVAGAIQFSNGSAFASDAANLFWDDTNNRLGVGTNAPTQALDVVGQGRFSDNILFTTDFKHIGRDINNSAISFGSINSNIQAKISTGGNFNVYNSGVAQVRFNVSAGGQTTISGGGSTSATTSLLVQNSAGTAALTVKDDLSATFGGNLTCGVGATLRFTGGGSPRIRGFNDISIEDDTDVHLKGIYNGNTRLPKEVIVGANTTQNASAQFQVDSTTKGVLFPRMTTTQKNAIASPAAGLVVYDSTTNKLCCYNGSTWNDLF